MGAIQKLCMAGGGPVKGRGTGTADNIPIMASNGEYMMPADSTKKIGAHVLDLLRLATHKRVAPKQGAIRKMADGGLVDENWRATDALGYGANLPAPPPVTGDTNYGQQAGSALGTLAKTVVGYPGYGINAKAAAPVAPTPAQGSLPASIVPSDAGAGRGSVNPSQPQTGAAPFASAAGVDLGGGITKLSPTGGAPLLTNAGASDNAALMGRGAISAMSQQALNGIQARQDAGDAAAANKARYDKEVAEAAATNAQGGFGTGETNLDPRTTLIRQLAGKNLTVRGAQAVTALGANDIAGGQLSVARDRLNAEAPEMAAKGALSISTLGARQAYAKALQSGDPKQVAAAEAALRGIEGRWERTFPPVRQLVVPGGTSADANGQIIHAPSQVYDPDTGEFRQAPAPQAKPQFEQGKVYKDAKGNKAKWDGAKFVPA